MYSFIQLVQKAQIMGKEQKKRVLITGGAGFIGAHLIQQLLEQDYSVFVLDNFLIGLRDHLVPFFPHPDFELIEGDIRELPFLKKALLAAAPQLIYHLAAIHFIPYCALHPTETLLINVLGTQHLLSVLENIPVSRFIFTSSGDIYAPANVPHLESDSPGSMNIYGVSKYCGEELIRLARYQYPRTQFIVARIFNAFGPGETNPHVLPDILSDLRKGNTLRLGNLEPERDYIYVSDVIEALLRLKAYQGSFTTFNIGTGVGHSVREFVEILEHIFRSIFNIELDAPKVRANERQQLVANISLAQRELKWKPKFTLEEGLKLTIR
jgi:UDP-glucose 4-epimerase